MKKIWTILCVSVLFAGCSYDDGDLWKSIDDMENKIKALEEKADQMNGEISSIRSIVDALNTGKAIAAVTESANGYTITFSDKTTISVVGGSAGTELPIVGIKAEEGIYYWTITKNGQTEWLKDGEGNKFPVAGVTPKVGVDENGHWTIDTGNGAATVTDSAGNPIKAAGEKGDSFFKSVTQDETRVTFTLADGTKITLPKTGAVNLVVNGAKQQYFYFGESRELAVALTGDAEITISKPEGWRVKTAGNTLTITAPAETNPYAEAEGEIAIIAIGETTAITKIAVAAAAYQAPLVLTFENVPASYLAGPTAYGDNLYSSYGSGQFAGYTDPATNLSFIIPDDYGMGAEFYNGGTAISQWNDMNTPGYVNQCSAFYADAVTGKGGNNGSATFAVSYVATYMGPNATYIRLADDNEAFMIDHLYVTNSTYAALVMRDGDGASEKMTYENKGWLKLTFQGLDKAGKAMGGTVDVYLADFRTTGSGGLLTEWKKIDLSSLGKVHKLGFWMTGSDNGSWGLNTPAYACLDDIAIRQ